MAPWSPKRLRATENRKTETIMTKQDLTFRIPDIHCVGCTRRITNVLERLDGVRSANVTMDDKSAQVDYDAEATDFEEMKQAVEKAGYTVERT